MGDSLAKLLVCEALGGNVEELELAGLKVAVEILSLFGRQGGIESCGGNPFFDERVYLVFHQSNERRDDECETIEDESRELIAEGFSSTRGEDYESRAIGEDGIDDSFLSATKGVVTKVLLENLLQCGHTAK